MIIRSILLGGLLTAMLLIIGSFLDKDLIGVIVYGFLAVVISISHLGSKIVDAIREQK